LWPTSRDGAHGKATATSTRDLIFALTSARNPLSLVPVIVSLTVNIIARLPDASRRALQIDPAIVLRAN
jgi:hypothetical protein